MKVTVDKSVWEKMKKNFKQAEQYEGRLGWFEEDRYGSDNDNLPMAQVAQWNEEGTEIAPPRPFMRVGLYKHIKWGAGRDQFQDIVYNVAIGNSIFTALEGSGKAFKIILRDVMIKWDTPPNSPTTVDIKGFNDPLIETSQLVANVNYKVAKRNS